MSAQLAHARAAGESAATRAELRAERQTAPRFSHRLAAYFYSVLVADGAHTSEELTERARAAGLIPGDARCVGSAFRALRKMAPVLDENVPRTRGHGTKGGTLFGRPQG